MPVVVVDNDVEENAELVRSIARGASEAAHNAEATLYRRFAHRAQLYGRKHLRSEDAARDLAQAVMLVVLEAARAGRIEDPMRLDRFVLGTCRNVALRTREQSVRAEPMDAADLEKLENVMSVSFALPEPDSMDKATLARCLTELDGRGRNVVYLSFTEGKAAEEIGALLETTAGNVRVLRHRALAQLRQCMDDCKMAAVPQ